MRNALEPKSTVSSRPTRDPSPPAALPSLRSARPAGAVHRAETVKRRQAPPSRARARSCVARAGSAPHAPGAARFSSWALASALLAAGLACGGAERAEPSSPAAEDADEAAPPAEPAGDAEEARASTRRADADAAAGAADGDEIIAAVHAALDADDPAEILVDVVMPADLLREALADVARALPDDVMRRELELAGIDRTEEGAIDAWVEVTASQIHDELLRLDSVSRFLRGCDGDVSVGDLEVVARTDLAEEGDAFADGFQSAVGEQFPELEDITLWASGCESTISLFVGRHRGGDAVYLLDILDERVVPERLEALEREHGTAEAPAAPDREADPPAAAPRDERCHDVFDHLVDLMADELGDETARAMEEERQMAIRDCAESLEENPAQTEESLECMMEATSSEEVMQCPDF